MLSSLPSRRTARIAGQAAVLALLVGGTAAYAANDTTVELTVDGKTQQVRAFGTTVDDVLDAAGVTVGKRDLVAPALDATVSEGGEVVVQHARRLEVTVDGQKQTRWTTALTVDDALQDLGLRADGAWLSTSRSARVGRDGMALTMLTSKDVRVLVDGTAQEASTTSLDVNALLAELKIVLGPTDNVTQPGDMKLRDGMVVDVNRVVTQDVPEVLAVKAPAEERPTEDLFKGETKVAEAGTDGARTLVWRITTTDGIETGRTQVSDAVTTAPAPRVVLVGTKARPVAPRAPVAASAPSAPSAPSPSVPDGSVWDRLAQCESGGNWSINTGNGYYGGLQFNLSTWQSNGGSGYPHQNTREQQIAVAERLRAARGFSPWPACSSKLGLR